MLISDLHARRLDRFGRMVGHFLCLLILVLLLRPGLLYAEADEPQPPALAEVLGKKITEQDLAPLPTMVRYWSNMTAEEQAKARREYRESALSRAVASALYERYVREQKLEPTEAEIQSFLESPMGRSEEMILTIQRDRVKELRRRIYDPAVDEKDREQLRAELQQAENLIKQLEVRGPDQDERKEMKASIPGLEEQLQNPDLVAAERDVVEQSLKYARRFCDLNDEQSAAEYSKLKAEIQRGVASRFVQQWKVNRALFKKYGGRIIWQQAGIEPIDAMRMWLEEQEKARDFVIHDPQLHASFWQYYRRDHPFTTDKPKGDEFDIPVWNKPPDQPRR